MIQLKVVQPGGAEHRPTIQLGRLREWFLRLVLQRLLDLVEDTRRSLPITFYFQVRSIKGRIVIDSF